MANFAEKYSMQLFYTQDVSEKSCALTPEESWHCIRVLRMKQGDSVFVTDGHGKLFEGRIMLAHPKKCEIELISIREHPQTSTPHLHIGIAPTKNTDRFEWFLEKATEIGIGEVTPVFCEHSERLILKHARFEKVLISAMKQSLKTHLPKLNEPVKFKDFIGQSISGQKFIAYCETGNESVLHHVYERGSDVHILIGPEGDFSPVEIELAISHGFIPVSLGESRLRTETAGIVACHTISLLNQKIKS